MKERMNMKRSAALTVVLLGILALAMAWFFLKDRGSMDSPSARIENTLIEEEIALAPGEELLELEIPPAPIIPISRLVRQWEVASDSEPAPRGLLSLIVDETGSIYVADGARSRVYQYSLEGDLMRTLETPPNASFSLVAPIDITVGKDGKLYVLDHRASDIKVFDREGRFISVYKCNLSYPTSMILNDDVLLVLDTQKGRIVRVDLEGKVLGQIGTQGEELGQLRHPSGIAISAEGILHVVDSGNNRILRFREDGSCIGSWSFPSPLSSPPRHDAALDSQGRLYVVEASAKRIHVFDPTGNHLGFWYPGLGENNIHPLDIAINREDQILITTMDRTVRTYQPQQIPKEIATPTTGKPCSPSHQVVLLGVDGAEWSTLIHLLSKNQLPNIQRLMKNGAYGYLKTLCPTATPAIWTSIATSLNPMEHGITGWSIPVYEEAGTAVCLFSGPWDQDILFCCELRAPAEIPNQTLSISCEPEALQSLEVGSDWQTVKVPLPRHLTSKPSFRIRLEFKDYVVHERDREAFLKEWSRHVDFDSRYSFVDDERVPLDCAHFKRVWLEDSATHEVLREIDVTEFPPKDQRNRLHSGWERPRRDQDFVLAGRPRRRPLSSTDRRGPALWNIFTAYGRTVGLVGYFVTWPAEEINGINITLKTTFRTDQNKEEVVASLSFPERYIDSIEDLLDFNRPLQHRYPIYSRLQPYIKADNIKRQTESVYQQDMVNTDIAIRVLSDIDPNFFSVYFEAPDIVAHMFHKQHNKKYFDEAWLNSSFHEPLAMEDLSNLINEAFTTTDELIGRVLERLDSDTTILLVSDHGFIYDGPEHWFAPPGVFIASGKNIAPVGEILDASIYDIAPTILYLAGLPVGKNMLGKPLVQAIDQTYLKRYPMRAIEQHGDRGSIEGKPVESVLDEELMQRFRDLGYIQ